MKSYYPHQPKRKPPTQPVKINWGLPKLLPIYFTIEELNAMQPELSGSRKPHVKSAYEKVISTIQNYEYRQRHEVKIHE